MQVGNQRASQKLGTENRRHFGSGTYRADCTADRIGMNLNKQSLQYWG